MMVAALVLNRVRGGTVSEAEAVDMIENAKKIYYECGHQIRPSTTISIYNFFSLDENIRFSATGF